MPIAADAGVALAVFAAVGVFAQDHVAVFSDLWFGT